MEGFSNKLCCFSGFSNKLSWMMGKNNGLLKSFTFNDISMTNCIVLQVFELAWLVSDDEHKPRINHMGDQKLNVVN